MLPLPSIVGSCDAVGPKCRTTAGPARAASTARCIASAVTGKASPSVPVISALARPSRPSGSASAAMTVSANSVFALPKPTKRRSPWSSNTTSTSRVGRSTRCTPAQSTPRSAQPRKGRPAVSRGYIHKVVGRSTRCTPAQSTPRSARVPGGGPAVSRAHKFDMVVGRSTRCTPAQSTPSSARACVGASSQSVARVYVTRSACPQPKGRRASTSSACDGSPLLKRAVPTSGPFPRLVNARLPCFSPQKM